MVVDPKARQQPRVASVFKDGRTDRTFLKNSWLEIVWELNTHAYDLTAFLEAAPSLTIQNWPFKMSATS
jgi:hypothetical protein